MCECVYCECTCSSGKREKDLTGCGNSWFPLCCTKKEEEGCAERTWMCSLKLQRLMTRWWTQRSYCSRPVCLTRASWHTLTRVVCRAWWLQHFRACREHARRHHWIRLCQARSSRLVRMSTSSPATWKGFALLHWHLPWVRSPIASSALPDCGLCYLTARKNLLVPSAVAGCWILTLCKLIDCGSWLWFSAPFSSFFTSMFLQNSKFTIKTSFNFELVSELLSEKCVRRKKTTWADFRLKAAVAVFWSSVLRPEVTSTTYMPQKHSTISLKRYKTPRKRSQT